MDYTVLWLLILYFCKAYIYLLNWLLCQELRAHLCSIHDVWRQVVTVVLL